jgi:hypothetical protein
LNVNITIPLSGSEASELEEGRICLGKITGETRTKKAINTCKKEILDRCLFLANFVIFII